MIGVRYLLTIGGTCLAGTSRTSSKNRVTGLERHHQAAATGGKQPCSVHTTASYDGRFAVGLLQAGHRGVAALFAAARSGLITRLHMRRVQQRGEKLSRKADYATILLRAVRQMVALSWLKRANKSQKYPARLAVDGRATQQQQKLRARQLQRGRQIQDQGTGPNRARPEPLPRCQGGSRRSY